MKLNIGENIRKYRTQMEWTQTQLAERLGVSIQSVSRWESGGGYPDMELLPELARVFAVSVDELLGCEEKELSQEELFRKINDFFENENPDPVEAAKLLRMIRYEHLQKASVLLLPVLSLQRGSLTASEVFMRELRLLADEYWQKGRNTSMKQLLLRLLARVEDEEHFETLLGEYSIPENSAVTRRSLLFERATAMNDQETCRILREEQNLADLLSYMIGQKHMRLASNSENSREISPAEVTCRRRESEHKLEILHLLNGVTPLDEYPLSGDGRMDMWTPVRVNLGINYAAQLAACGETDKALCCLEDAAYLTEQAADYPWFAKNSTGRLPLLPQECPAVENRMADLPHIRVRRSRTSTSVVFIAETDSDPYSSIDMRAVQFTDILASLTGQDMFCHEGFRTPWLDPIRDHPRYKAVVERIEACRDRLIGQKENKV